MAFIDLTGQQFGKLTVIEYVGKNKYNASLWRCICNCNGINEVIATTGHLRAGQVKSCGCLMSEIKTTHGGSYDKLYPTWRDMIIRCNDPNSNIYKYYGGRGISICDEWYDYNNFKMWCEDTKNDPNTTLDRIDVNGNYCPENCRWATKKEQARNKRNNIVIEYFGEIHTLVEWCEIFGLPYNVIQQRITRSGWDFWKAISTPLPDHYYTDIGIYV